jgi:S1-C subfamily serine protease
LRRLLPVLLIAASWASGSHAAPVSYPKLDIAMPQASSGPVLSAVDFFKQISPSIYLIVAAKDEQALKERDDVYEGSAVAITPTLALTNCHIVKGRQKLVLIQKKERDANVVVVASDPRTDRCIIETQAMKLHPIAGVRSYKDVLVGEKVFAVGNPSGLTATLSEGIVSGLRTQRGVRYVQTSAAISPGSSGGGLFDERGNLLGITSFKIEDAENLNFAIAAEDYWRKGASRPIRARHGDDESDSPSRSRNSDERHGGRLRSQRNDDRDE